MKQTWTGLPEIKDPAPRSCTIEQDQEDYLIEKLGLVKWGELCQIEAEAKKQDDAAL